jgi:magnesium transporter
MNLPKLTIEKFETLLEDGNNAEILSLLHSMDPADVADLLEEIDLEDQERVFAILDTEMASDILVEMEPGEVDDFVDRIPPQKLAEMISEMAPDDQADFYGNLEEDEQKKVLNFLPENDRADLKRLLGYDEDSAGGIMTPEFCSIQVDATVQEAIMAIADEEFDDPITMIFAVDKEMNLKGAIHVSELLSKPRNSRIADVIDDIQIVAGTDEDQESVANNFRKYDLYVMPVVDNSGMLVGRITADDVMDVIQEEALEDIAHMAGAPDMERKEDSPVKVAGLRLPWLMITMFAGLIISVIIQKMIGLTTIEGLAAYIPVVMAMGGNTGMQASAITVRGIALGEIEYGKLLKTSLREIFVGMLMGCVCGLLTGIIIWFQLTQFGGMTTVSPMRLAFVVGVSMCVAMAYAALCGTLLPIILHKWKVDPALASGPFVTTGNDLAASMIYFGMCFFLLKM